MTFNRKKRLRKKTWLVKLLFGLMIVFSTSVVAAGSNINADRAEVEPVSTTTKPAGHCGHGDNMAGIPKWMFFSGIFVLFAGTAFVRGIRTSPEAYYNSESGPLDLFAGKIFGRLVKQKWFPLLIQTPAMLAFIFIIIAGMIGATYTNIAPIFTWTIWWGLLVFIVLLAGKAFCAVCPWDAIAGIMQRRSLFKNRAAAFSRNISWPPWAKNIYPATALFIGLTWLELGFGVTRNAPATAMLGLLMLGLVAGSAMIFERRSFCRYGCLIGRISGLYSMFAPVELRPRSTEICSGCRTKDCYTGNAAGAGCPTFEFPGKLDRNTYCTFCTECARTCTHDNIGLFIRPFSTDLNNETKYRRDEAVLAVVLLSLTSFHGLTMTPFWYGVTGWFEGLLGVGYKTAFSVFMALCLVAPIGLFYLVAWGGAKLSSAEVSVDTIFRGFAFSLIPIALFYHAAHNVMHFFGEAQFLLPLLSDPFGWGWNLFGTARLEPGPLLSLQTIWYIQTLLIIVGHLYGITVGDRVARNLLAGKRKATLVQLPMVAVMILFSFYSLWLIHQPMEMRTGF